MESPDKAKDQDEARDPDEAVSAAEAQLVISEYKNPESPLYQEVHKRVTKLCMALLFQIVAIENEGRRCLVLARVRPEEKGNSAMGFVLDAEQEIPPEAFKEIPELRSVVEIGLRDYEPKKEISVIAIVICAVPHIKHILVERPSNLKVRPPGSNPSVPEQFMAAMAALKTASPSSAPPMFTSPTSPATFSATSTLRMPPVIRIPTAPTTFTAPTVSKASAPAPAAVTATPTPKEMEDYIDSLFDEN